MPGFIHRQVSHDPDSKIILPKGTKFKDVLIKACLHKTYPQHGPYTGGIVFRRSVSPPSHPNSIKLIPQVLRSRGWDRVHKS